jgi:hypothetical protein
MPTIFRPESGGEDAAGGDKLAKVFAVAIPDGGRHSGIKAVPH